MLTGEIVVIDVKIRWDCNEMLQDSFVCSKLKKEIKRRKQKAFR